MNIEITEKEAEDISLAICTEVSWLKSRLKALEISKEGIEYKKEHERSLDEIRLLYQWDKDIEYYHEKIEGYLKVKKKLD